MSSVDSNVSVIVSDWGQFGDVINRSGIVLLVTCAAEACLIYSIFSILTGLWCFSHERELLLNYFWIKLCLYALKGSKISLILNMLKLAETRLARVTKCTLYLQCFCVIFIKKSHSIALLVCSHSVAGPSPSSMLSAIYCKWACISQLASSVHISLKVILIIYVLSATRHLIKSALLFLSHHCSFHQC